MVNHIKIFVFLTVFLIPCIFAGCGCSDTSGPTEPAEILPIADAGPDQTCMVGQYIFYDGSDSRPGKGESIIKWRWTHAETNPNSEVYLVRDDRGKIGFDKEGIYKLILTIQDEFNTSKPDTMIVNVLPRERIIFEDPNLEVNIRWELRKPVEDLTETDLLSVDTILCNQAMTSKITGLKGLDNCPNLEYLGTSNQRIKDISGIEGALKLKKADLDQNRTLSDISPLSSLIELEYLDLNDNLIEDVSPLSNLRNLKYLRIDFNPVYSITPLAGLRNLETLYLADTPLRDISALAEMRDLEILWLTKCDVVDLSPLTRLEKLVSIKADMNIITDLSPLSGLTQLEVLYVGENLIENISTLESLVNLNTVRLWGNKIQDIKPLVDNTGIGEGDLVYLSGNPLNEKSINEYIPALINRGVTVFFGSGKK